MSHPTREPLVLAGEPVRERSDAARNRAALLDAAQGIVDRKGVDALTTDEVAAAAGVGKGTVFRRFGSREGLMAALLDHAERGWQAEVLAGPPPLGPGAPPMDRLLAFGRSRVRHNLRVADLARAAGRAGTRSYAAYSFSATHVRHLLDALGTPGDIALLVAYLLAPIEPVILEQQLQTEGMSLERIDAGWEELVRRLVG